MSYQDKVSALAADAEKLEGVYHTAEKAGETGSFRDRAGPPAAFK